MKDEEKNLEICSKFYTVLSEIHSERLTIGLQIVEAMKGRIFLAPVILDEKGRDVTMIRPEVERKVIILLAPGTHSHFESGKFSQFWPEPGTNPAQWVRLKTPFRVHPKQPN